MGRTLRQLTNGFVGPTRDILVETGIRYIQGTHIKSGRIEFDRRPFFVSQDWHELRPRIHLREGDVLIVRSEHDHLVPVQVIDDWKGSTGLVRPDFFDWPARIEQDMAEHDPDVVVLGFGGNDTQNLTTDDGILQLGTPEWEAEYQRRIGEVLDLIEAPGRTVYWIGLPLTTSDAIETLRPVLSRALRAEAKDRPWVHLIDTRDALAPDGTFTSQLPGDDGELVTTMAPDQIHPSLEGGVRIVREFLPQLREERKLDA